MSGARVSESVSPAGRRAIVVGAGLGGLSAAIRLAAAGWRVTVYEQQRIPGGKAGSEARGRYRFDTGPSLLTMPYVVEELFAEAGRDWRDYLEVERLEVICNYFWPDGTRLHAYGDPDRFAAEVEEQLGEPAEHVRRYLQYAGRIHDTAAEIFLRHSLHDRRTYLSRLFWSRVWKLGRIDAMRTMNRANESFFRDSRLVQLFNRYATYNGSSPYQTPATLNIIPFVEYVHGGYSVVGGIHSLPRALERLALELGVEVRYGERVDRIVTQSRTRRRAVATGVEVGSRFEPADAVVSNVDVSVAYPQLLGDEDAKQLQRYRRLEPSSSGLVFYWGVRGEFAELTVNNIFFSADYRSEFRQIFTERRCPDDPTIYLNITSKVTPGDSPEGGENWFVLANAPYEDGQEWTREVEHTRAVVVRRLSETLGRDVSGLIEEEGIMTPPDIERKTMSYRGALYGISSNSRLAAFARHPNRSPDCAGLYFCGGSAHPGGGMPLVMLSGKIAADLIGYDYA
ncbi:MAG: phytoene desaturase family protein [Spirochaetales bacterium]